MTFHTVHSLAVRSLAIVVQSHPVKRAWAFPVQVAQISDTSSAVALGAGGVAADTSATGAEVQPLPDGNHGETLEVAKA
jgi:hypothetical protein